MPYIKPERRPQQDTEGAIPEEPGDLNYQITKLVGARFDPEAKTRWDERTVAMILALVKQYMDWQIDIMSRKFGYTLLNEVMGVFACAEEEHDRREWKGTYELQKARSRFYQTVVAPYEELKIAENGDIG